MGRTFDDTTFGGDRAPAGYRDSTPADRMDAIGQLAGLMAATHTEILSLVAEMDRSKDWAADGATGPAPWLVAVCGLTRDHASEWVRVAHALEELPALRAAYASGELSWDQVRPVTRFATPDNETAVLAEIAGLSARQITAMAAERTPITRPEAQASNRDQSLVFRPDRRRGGLRVTGRFPTDMGAAIAAALGRHAETMGPNPITGTWDPLPYRLAQALHDLATTDTAHRSANHPDPTVVVIHADARVVDDTIDGNGLIGDLALSHDGVLRALCDCRVEAHLHGPNGATVGVARAGRRIPHYLSRVVHRRDRCCRFPGCERPIRHLHHIWHWAKGGPTNVDNLVGLCWSHHTLVHDGGWTIHGHPDHHLTFRSPFGIHQWTSRPTPLRPDVQQLLHDP